MEKTAHKKNEGSNSTKNECEYWRSLIEEDAVPFDLYTACAVGDFDYVESYLSDAKYLRDIINKKNTGGWTPLMYVCYIGREKIVDLLIRERADILAEDEKRGRTPLMLAASSGSASVVTRLVENGAEVNAMDKNGQTALFHATEPGHLNIVKFLLKKNADVYISQKTTGYTPFMEAARQGHEYVFKEYLDHGTDLSLVCHSGLTCRDLAYQNDKMVIVNMIDNCTRRTSSSLRDEPELVVPDLGMDGREKVQDWFKRGHFTEDAVNQENFLHEEHQQSHPMAIQCGFRRDSSGDAYGKSVDTIIDCDRTPVGTPVDSIFQQYMTGNAKHFGRYLNADALPDITAFLEDLNLGRYTKVFIDELIDFRLLISLTDDDFKGLDIKLGPRKIMKEAINKWKVQTGWSSKGRDDEHCQNGQEINNLKRQLADAYEKLEHITKEFTYEKQARAASEAEQMEERARRSQMSFIAEKIQHSCQELRSFSNNLRERVKTLETAVTCDESITEEGKLKFNTLHNEMKHNVENIDHVLDVVLGRIRKMLCDDLTDLSDSDSPSESSCTSVSKSESSIAYSSN